jgi:hypothetical protein
LNFTMRSDGTLLRKEFIFYQPNFPTVHYYDYASFLKVWIDL